MPGRSRYYVFEIFQSIQGEGYNSGVPMTFVRFAGCNLKCSFCDTPASYQRGTSMTYSQIIETVSSFEHHTEWVCFTGGEPTLQLDQELILAMKALGMKIALETNGTSQDYNYVNIDHVVYSPKAEGKKPKTFFWIDEVRIPVIAGINIDEYTEGLHDPTLGVSPKVYLSPVFDDDNKINQDNLNATLALLERHPKFRLSVQIHKFLNIR
jgi:organic radical activating enzyme